MNLKPHERDRRPTYPTFQDYHLNRRSFLQQALAAGALLGSALLMPGCRGCEEEIEHPAGIPPPPNPPGGTTGAGGTTVPLPPPEENPPRLRGDVVEPQPPENPVTVKGKVRAPEPPRLEGGSRTPERPPAPGVPPAPQAPKTAETE